MEERRCAIVAICEAAIAQFSLPVEEDHAGESVRGLTFVEDDLETKPADGTGRDLRISPIETTQPVN